MRNILVAFFALAVVCCDALNAQQQTFIWEFGVGNAIDFSTGSPVILPASEIGSDVGAGDVQEGTASISDGDGNLLFYTGGEIIWNRFDQVMPNGTGIFGGNSSTQSSLIIPLPGSDHLFYVFTADEFQNYSFTQRGYRYSIVDMCLDSARGGVVTGEKNIWMADSSTEKLAACADATATGYWLLGHTICTNKFYAWHLTSTGITGPVISSIGTVHGWIPATGLCNTPSAQGQMKINSAGNKIALAIGNFQPAIIDLFDFDNASGIVSNFCHMSVDSAMYKSAYGVEFSPDGTKLYAGFAGGTGGKWIYQFDLNAAAISCSAIYESRVKIFQSAVNSVMFGLQLGPDNKIYAVSEDYTHLGRINAPDVAGLGADYESMAVTLSGVNNYSFPAFIAGNNYANGLIQCGQTTGNTEPEYANKNAYAFPNPFSNQTIISCNRQMHHASLRIFNLQGQLVREILFSGNAVAMNRENLSSGTYFYQVISEDIIFEPGKLIIQ